MKTRIKSALRSLDGFEVFFSVIGAVVCGMWVLTTTFDTVDGRKEAMASQERVFSEQLAGQRKLMEGQRDILLDIKNKVEKIDERVYDLHEGKKRNVR